jgi:hypothetical protein
MDQCDAALLSAAEVGDLVEVRRWLAMGAGPKHFMETPLHRASAKGHLDVVWELLAYWFKPCALTMGPGDYNGFEVSPVVVIAEELNPGRVLRPRLQTRRVVEK